MGRSALGEVEMNDLIEVVCMVFPSGECFWFEACDEDGKYRDGYGIKVNDKWKSENPEYMETDCSAGMVLIKMPREKYIAIGASAGPGCFEFPGDE